MILDHRLKLVLGSWECNFHGSFLVHKHYFLKFSSFSDFVSCMKHLLCSCTVHIFSRASQVILDNSRTEVCFCILFNSFSL